MSKFAFYRAFLHFAKFSPKNLLWLNFLALLQAATGSLGFLLLIPLVQLAGLDVASYTSQLNGSLNLLLEWLNKQAWTQSLSSVLTLYVVVMLCIAGLNYHRSILGVSVQQAYVRKMRSELYQSILESNWSFLASRRSAEYLHRVGAQVQTMNTSANQLIGIMHLLLSMMVYTTLMFFVHWQFTLATIAVGIIVAAILLPIRYSVRDAGARRLRGYREIFATLAEHLSNLKMIKASAREAQFSDAVGDVSIELEAQQIRMQRAGAIVGFANSAALAIGFAVLLYIGVEYYQVALAEFFILMLVMSRILPQLSGMQQTIQGIVYSLPAFVDIEEILLDTQAANELALDQTISALTMRDAVQLKEVGFGYAGETTNLLFENLNLTIKARETVALTGPSGVGKTTIADLLSSLVMPTSGNLLVDGKPLTREDRLRWRRSMAYVTQEVYLFNDTIRQNLSWSAPNATETEIWQALEMAALDQHIRNLPNGLETKIGDRGIRFSGGERQRLAIARALLMTPQLLILDEATSALDKQNETKIQEVIRRLHGSLTVVIIAHRESTIAVADRVIDVAQLRVKNSK